MPLGKGCVLVRVQGILVKLMILSILKKYDMAKAIVIPVKPLCKVVFHFKIVKFLSIYRNYGTYGWGSILTIDGVWCKF